MEKKTVKNLVRVTSAPALRVASILTSSINEVMEAQSNFQRNNYQAYGSMADKFQSELDAEGTNTCGYKNKKNVD